MKWDGIKFKLWGQGDLEFNNIAEEYALVAKYLGTFILPSFTTSVLL